MAAHMVLILDGISPGLTHQGIQWTYSGVQAEWKLEVTYVEVINNVEYYKIMLNLEKFFPLWILPPHSVEEGNGCHIVWGELPGCVCWWQRSWGPVNYHDIVFAGNATRLCMGDGNWTEPNVLECESLQFLQIRLEVFCLCCSIVVAYQMFQACCYLEVLLFSS